MATITLTLFLWLLTASLCGKEGNRSRAGGFGPSGSRMLGRKGGDNMLGLSSPFLQSQFPEPRPK